MNIHTNILLSVGVIVLMSGCAAKNSGVSERPSDKAKKSAVAKNSKVILVESSQTCKLDQDQRQVAINANDSGGCKVDYEKFASTQKIAEANHEIEICSRVKENVVQNLERAGFQCDSRLADAKDAKTPR